MDYSRITIVGRVAQAPARTEGGMVFFRVAKNWYDAENAKHVDYYNCRAWNSVADQVMKLVHLGNSIFIEGSVIQHVHKIGDETAVNWYIGVQVFDTHLSGKAIREQAAKEQQQEPF